MSTMTRKELEEIAYGITKTMENTKNLIFINV